MSKKSPMIARRQALGLGLSAAAGLAIAPLAAAFAAPLPKSSLTGSDRRLLAFENLHTGEKLTTPYWINGAYEPEACRQIDWLLRDHRSGNATTMSRELLDLLHRLRSVLESPAPFQVISGYRSPQTNAKLASASSGVASNSLHMKGIAIDIRLPGCALPDLRQAALSLKAGGVGYYPKSNFVHVDTGRVRAW